MNYGTALPVGFNLPKSAFWLQKDLTTKNPFEQLKVQRGDRVMDCGAYAGTFAAASLEGGASQVTCYEAAPKNAILLRDNMTRYGAAVTVVEAALTAGDNSSVPLTLSGFSGANSILPSANRPKSISVAAVNFRRELLTLRPQVLKMDVEGAEYDLLDGLRPGDFASVEALFIEFHPVADRDARIRRVTDFITAEGFFICSTRRRAFVAHKGTRAQNATATEALSA